MQIWLERPATQSSLKIDLPAREIKPEDLEDFSRECEIHFPGWNLVSIVQMPKNEEVKLTEEMVGQLTKEEMKKYKLTATDGPQNEGQQLLKTIGAVLAFVSKIFKVC